MKFRVFWRTTLQSSRIVEAKDADEAELMVSREMFHANDLDSVYSFDSLEVDDVIPYEARKKKN